ncbi:IPO11 protein, partial [Polypterus senegalus]
MRDIITHGYSVTAVRMVFMENPGLDMRSAISEEEKNSLRAGLITNFNEPVNQIATQIAVLIAKVARLDCPRQWPELIPILIESVKVQDDLQQHRALLTFYHVTKTLSSKRLSADKKLFQDLGTLAVIEPTASPTVHERRNDLSELKVMIAEFKQAQARDKDIKKSENANEKLQRELQQDNKDLEKRIYIRFEVVFKDMLVKIEEHV